MPYLHPSRTPRTLELLGMAIQFAVNVEMRFKHELACWRPIEYSPHVQPMITTPGHGSLPSGHATQAYIVAHVLQTLLGLEPDHPTSVQLLRQAARIATNRVIAGVHFPIDSIAGRLLGTTLGEYFVARCTESGKGEKRPWKERCFDGAHAGFEASAIEFIPARQPLDGDADRAPFYARGKTDDSGLAARPLFEHCWQRAVSEWQDNAKSPFTALEELPPPAAES